MYPLRTDLEERFLKWWLLTPEFTRRASKLQARTVLPKINKGSLAQLPVPVPSSTEQRRIVEILEEHFSHLDAATAGITTAQARLQRLDGDVLASEYRQLLGEPVALPPAPAGVDDSHLPDLPASWTWQRLGDLADVVGGVTKDAKRQGDPSFVEVPYLRVANVQRGRLDLTDVTRIRVSEEKAATLRLLPGDVLLNEGGDRDKLGRGWVWEDQIPDCIHQNHVFRARVRGATLRPDLLSYAANTIGARWCKGNATQSVNLASISLRKIRLMPVPVPPQEQQDEISSRITERRASYQRLASSLTAVQRHSRALRRSLLSAAFTGRLTGRSGDLDVAEELAARDGAA